MRLVWIGAFVLLVASLASLVSHQQGGRLMQQTWASATTVFPESQLADLQEAVPAFAGRILKVLPEQLRQKFAAKTWTAIELMTFRFLVLWHVIPAFVIGLIVGWLEGAWARANQKTLIKMHSPMRFSLAVTTLALSPVLSLLWIAAPINISATLLVVALGATAIFGARNVIVHAPTQF